MELIKKTIKPTIILGAIIALGLLPFDYRWSLSILFGVLIAIVHLNRLERNITAGIKNQNSKVKWALMFFVDMALLSSPLIFAVIFPEYLNIVAVAIGLFINKIILYVLGLKEKGEGMRE